MNESPNGLDSRLSEAIFGTIREPMVVLNQDLCVVVVSKAFLEKFHTLEKDATGKLFYELGNGQWNIPALRTLLEQVIPEKKTVEEFEVSHDFPDLGKRLMIVNAREIDYENGQKKMLLSIRDITDERALREQRESLMRQKDTLLREMRHRIANSLQLIASVILLKAGMVRSVESKRHLEDAHDRILSIATVQRNLDPTNSDDTVPVCEYLTTLCQSLSKSMISAQHAITISVIGDEGTATPDEAISLGLITTELVINSLKHAFPNGKGKVAITYAVIASSWKLTIKDDGVGYRAISKLNEEGLGTNIVDSLVKQLNADVTRETSSSGTVVSISYPKNLTVHTGSRPFVAKITSRV